MQYSFHEIAQQLNVSALPDGGWRGKHAGPSITVSSEVSIALMDYLDQVPPPLKDDERAFRDELTNKIDAAIPVIESLFLEREPSSLDDPNCALALAALCTYRAFRIRSGRPLDPVNKPFLDKVLTLLGQPSADLAQAIGPSWAYIKGINLAGRALANGKDADLLNLIQKSRRVGRKQVPTFRAIEVEARTLRTDLLNRDDSLRLDGYTSAILLDLAISTLSSTATSEMEKARAHKVKQAALENIEHSLKDHRASDVFPIWNFEGSSQAEYQVVVRASLLASMAALLEDESIRHGDGHVDRIRLFLYSISDSMPRGAAIETTVAFELGHCLRALSETKINERDTDAVITVMRESERLTLIAPELLELVHHVQKSPPMSFRSARGLFLYVSPHLYVAILGSLMASFYILTVFLYYNALASAFVLCVIWLFILSLPTAFLVFAKTESFFSKTKEERAALWVQFLFYGAAGAIVVLSAIGGTMKWVVDAIKSLQ